jgi:hypothetical protein
MVSAAGRYQVVWTSGLGLWYRQQGCHIGRLLGKSRPKDVVRARPDERPSRPTAGGRPKRTAAWWMAQADGLGGRPRRTASPAAERTATLQKNSQEHHNIL